MFLDYPGIAIFCSVNPQFPGCPKFAMFCSINPQFLGCPRIASFRSINPVFSAIQRLLCSALSILYSLTILELLRSAVNQSYLHSLTTMGLLLSALSTLNSQLLYKLLRSALYPSFIPRPLEGRTSEHIRRVRPFNLRWPSTVEALEDSHQYILGLSHTEIAWPSVWLCLCLGRPTQRSYVSMCLIIVCHP